MAEDHDIIELMLRACRRMEEKGKEARDYGTGDLLFRSEIHMLEAVKRNKDANASTIADVMEITKGAVSQIIQKLIVKKLLTKYKLDTNKKEIFFKLTAKGELACREHDHYHRKLHASLIGYLNELDKKDSEVIRDFLKRIIKTFS